MVFYYGDMLQPFWSDDESEYLIQLSCGVGSCKSGLVLILQHAIVPVKMHSAYAI